MILLQNLSNQLKAQLKVQVIISMLFCPLFPINVYGSDNNVNDIIPVPNQADTLSSPVYKPHPPASRPSEQLRRVRQRKYKLPTTSATATAAATVIENDSCEQKAQNIESKTPLSNAFLPDTHKCFDELNVPSAPPKTAKVQKIKQQKINLLNEFLSSEQSYALALSIFLHQKVNGRTIAEEFLAQELIKKKEMFTFYSLLKSMQSIHTYSSDLVAQLAADFDPKNGDISVVKMERSILKNLQPEKLKEAYKEYFAQFANFKKIMDRLQNKPKFRVSNFIKRIPQDREKFKKIIEDFQENAAKVLKEKRSNFNDITIDSFLILPVQKIPRYELMLNELTKVQLQSKTKQEPIDELIDLKSRIKNVLLEINTQQENMRTANQHR